MGLSTDPATHAHAREYLDELELLADTAGAVCVAKHLQRLHSPEPSTYIGKGKLKQIASEADSLQADLIIFDDELTGSQIRTIEKITKKKVLDRTGLILDIFASRARTTASRNQVELAQLQYLLPRLTRFWTHLSRQSGGIGTKGPGETQIETDRRLIGRRIATLKESLERIDRQRSTQSRGRRDHHRIALVGYTNAGKSTLMNVLTETDVLAEDRLFATLDSTVRRWKLFNRTVLLSDTVGFIRKLPHHLVESFKSTLDEVREADLLLHVVDAGNPLWEEHMGVVEQTLQELGASGTPTVTVFNKVDSAEEHELMAQRQAWPDAVFVSARRGIGLDRLRKTIDERIERDYVSFTVHLPLSDYSRVVELRKVAVLENESYDERGIHLTGRMDRRVLGRFADLQPEIAHGGAALLN